MSFSHKLPARPKTLRNALTLAFALWRLSLLQRAKAEVFTIRDNVIGEAFFEQFDWQTFDDPTHGVVNYVDMSTARNNNLSYVNGNTFVMRADDTSIVPSTARGRDSIRITSTQTYTDGLYVLDLNHMPAGCGTWPAWWTVGSNWPNNGEIDIIEGVNSQGDNLVSLHTTGNCSMSNEERWMQGSATSNDCNTAVNYNQGCGVSLPEKNSFGPAFNSAGGGWYAMQRSSTTGINVWFWSRQSSNVPTSIAGGSAFVDSSQFGTPDATFSCADCDWESHFGPHNIVFDLTFCGDWAGSAYGNSGCPGSCSDQVLNNPSAFSEAYWSINAMRIYQ